MNVQKLRNFVKTEFVKSGTQCIYESSGLIKGLSRLLQKSVWRMNSLHTGNSQTCYLTKNKAP